MRVIYHCVRTEIHHQRCYLIVEVGLKFQLLFMDYCHSFWLCFCLNIF